MQPSAAPRRTLRAFVSWFHCLFEHVCVFSSGLRSSYITYRLRFIKCEMLRYSGMGARSVEPPIRKPPRKNQSYDGRLTGPTPSDSARRDLSISAIKKFDHFLPLKSTPKLGKKADTRWRRQRHPAASTIALGPPQAPKFLAWKRCLHRSKALGQECHPQARAQE
jgi:hypothetical protein